MPRVHQGMDRASCLQRAAVRSVGVLLRLQIDLENRFENQHGRHLHHAITDRWNPQRPLLPARLWNPPTPDCMRSIRLVSELLSPFTHTLLCAVLSVYYEY